MRSRKSNEEERSFRNRDPKWTRANRISPETGVYRVSFNYEHGVDVCLFIRCLLRVGGTCTRIHTRSSTYTPYCISSCTLTTLYTLVCVDSTPRDVRKKNGENRDFTRRRFRCTRTPRNGKRELFNWNTSTPNFARSLFFRRPNATKSAKTATTTLMTTTLFAFGRANRCVINYKSATL